MRVHNLFTNPTKENQKYQRKPYKHISLGPVLNNIIRRLQYAKVYLPKAVILTLF